MADSKKRLALAIIDFLNTSVRNGTLQPEDQESIDVATSCISGAFNVDPTDEAATKDALGGQNLLKIYSVYEKLKGKSTASTEGGSSAHEGRPTSPTVPLPGTSTGAPSGTETGSPNAESEKLKGRGNAAMQAKDYDSAIGLYTQALEIAPLNPIYLSNRAAAFSATSQHDKAKNDAEMATAADPSYTKAWSRLGLALFALGDAKGSMEAYKKGIDAEGNGGSAAMKKAYETARKRVEEGEGEEGEMPDLERSDSSPASGAGGMPDLGALGNLFGGGGRGQGGMPDLGAMMQNPMLRQMASNMMSNPDMMNNLMNNPTLRDMASRFGGGGAGAGAGAGAGGEGGARGQGGGMPDLAGLMNDPSIAEMARNLMGGAGRGGTGQQ